MAMIDMSNRRLEPILVSPLRGIVAKLHSKLAVLLFVSFVGFCTNLIPASAAPTGAAAVALAASPSAPGAGQLPAVTTGQEDHSLTQKAVEITRVFGLPITNSMIVSWVVALGLIVFAQVATRNMRRVPEGA